LPGQPTVILDVAHNPHAAAVLEKNLGNMGFHPYTYAVFGMLSDKDIALVVKHMAPRIDHWFCAGLPGPRALTADQLASKVKDSIAAHQKPGEDDVAVSTHASVAEALAAAHKLSKPDDRIVVFGSFLTVAGALQASGRSA
jgi:dihydrofolate synthase/folylpolyglutamate synthase